MVTARANFSESQAYGYAIFFTLSIFFFSFVILGGLPFAARADATTEIATDFEDGNAFRQIFYISFFVFTTVVAVRHRGLAYFKIYPILFVALFVYSTASIFWAIRPDIATRRLVLAIIFVMIVCNWFAILGSKGVLESITKTFAILIVLSVIAVIVVPGWAKHPPGERDPALIGMWRGLFVHKNHAAAACAAAVILFGHRLYSRRRWQDGVVLAFTVLLLVESGGKTSLALAFPSLLAGIIFSRYAAKRSVSHVAFYIIFITCVLLPLFGMIFASEIGVIFSDPLAFTGRVQIWDLSLRYIADHPWLGSGYGSFWQIGETSLLAQYSSEPWLEGVYHAHDGYIELALMLGIPGAILAIFATIFWPLIQVFTKASSHPKLCGLLFSWILFSILFNLLEAQIWTKDWEIWLVMVITAITAKEAPLRGPMRLSIPAKITSRRIAIAGE